MIRPCQHDAFEANDTMINNAGQGRHHLSFAAPALYTSSLHPATGGQTNRLTFLFSGRQDWLTGRRVLCNGDWFWLRNCTWGI